MGVTSIEWTDRSINPIRASKLNIAASGFEVEDQSIGHYCEKISPGCANCYASTLQKRFRMPAFKGAKRADVSTMTVQPYLDEKKLAEVLRRRKPTKYFWCDMTDMFGAWVPDEWIDKCFAAMALTPQHTHQVLTKRPERMAEYTGSDDTARRLGLALAAAAARTPGAKFTVRHRADGLNGFQFPNVWLGTSVENMDVIDSRVMALASCPASVRFISFEPLLGPLPSIRGYLEQGIHWAIVGGESGHGARPCDLDWIESLRDQCKAADVPCFIKQLGANCIANDDEFGWMTTGDIGLKDKKGGDMSEWPADLRVRQFPRTATANL